MKAFIWTLQNDQLPVALLAGLVEHFIGNGEVTGSSHAQAWI